MVAPQNNHTTARQDRTTRDKRDRILHNQDRSIAAPPSAAMQEARDRRVFFHSSSVIACAQSRDIRLIYRALASQQDRHGTNGGASKETGDLPCSRIP